MFRTARHNRDEDVLWPKVVLPSIITQVDSPVTPQVMVSVEECMAQMTLHWNQIAADLNGRRPFWPVLNGQRWTFETSNVTCSQQSTLINTLNPELMLRSIPTDEPMH